MAKRTKKKTKNILSQEPSAIIQAGIVFVFLAAIVLVAYAIKNFT